MIQRLSAAVFCLLLVSASHLSAQDVEWRLGGRGIFLSTGATSQELGDTGATFKTGSGGGLEFDAIVVFSEMFGAEFSVGASANRLDVTGAQSCCSAIDGGRVWLFPVTALAQVHIPVFGKWDPYVGLGAAWAIPYYNLSTDLENAGVERIELEGNAGIAAQIGVNYNLDNRWFANIDLRYLGVTLDARVRTDAGDFEPVTLNIKPFVVGIGFVHRF